ncbi:DMT family transporter [Dokdonia sinensis]|uniref:DMT family transporter n=1 Tax=Dokdonia sinensis TaxID=2479847 RepID=A0A3M0G4R1_9FLAO|nr:DMT family transporter [Dokdonia sinensis]RMB56149.1 DMT family transporter [Dokdonia sinensis]
MIYLLLSIAASSLIFVIFKLFSKYEVNTLHAIIVNYFVACICGLSLYKGSTAVAEIPSQDWFYGTVILGLIFITVFNLMALTTQRSGLSVVSVATKMSVVIPILFGVLYYKESLGMLKIIGILLALVAVYLASIKSKEGISIKKKNLIFPFLVFLGSGAIDTSIKFMEGEYVAADDVPIFSATIFGAAAVIGVFIILYQIVTKTFTFKAKNVVAGICLGIPNYFSIYMLVQALRADTFDSSTLFTINNVAIVMVSTFLGILLFKEKLIFKNWLGIGMAVVSIVLVWIASK